MDYSERYCVQLKSRIDLRGKANQQQSWDRAVYFPEKKHKRHSTNKDSEKRNASVFFCGLKVEKRATKIKFYNVNLRNYLQ